MHNDMTPLAVEITKRTWEKIQFIREKHDVGELSRAMELVIRLGIRKIEEMAAIPVADQKALFQGIVEEMLKDYDADHT